MESEDLEALIAGNVRAARARTRLRQEDLADAMGWQRATVTSLENGSRRLTLVEAVMLCGALKISLRDLLHGAPEDVFTKLGLSEAR